MLKGELDMNRRSFQFLLILFAALCNNLFSQPTDNKIIIGERTSIASNILFEERNLFIHLPESYNSSQKKYPVLYLLDAEVHFKYTVGIIQFLVRNNKMPETIVVGIPNTYRNRDFFPEKVFNITGSGGANNFLEFLKEELFPHIDKNYRTQPYRTLVGHSLCGMFCFYSLLSQPDLFNSYIAISPAVMADESYIVSYIQSNFSKYPSLNKSIYFTAGSEEPEEFLQMIDVFRDILRKYAPDDLVWDYKLMEDEDHGSQVFIAIYDGLLMFYKGWKLTDDVAKNGLKDIMRHFETLSEKYGYKIEPSENALNTAGYYFLGEKAYEKAIEIFEKNVALYPLSANVYDSLGEAFELSGQTELASKNYEQAYLRGKELNSPNLYLFKQNLDRTKNKVTE